MKGVNGKILRVDLASGQLRIEKPPEDYYKLYLGGRGFIIKTLLEEVPKGTDPFGPENKLMFNPKYGHGQRSGPESLLTVGKSKRSRSETTIGNGQRKRTLGRRSASSYRQAFYFRGGARYYESRIRN